MLYCPFGGDLKICHWNIGGLKSRVYGSKDKDVNFLQVVNDHEIILLTETHTNDKTHVAIPGYYTFQISRPKHKKARKHSGGIALIVKEELKNSVTFTSSKSNNIGWIRIQKKFINSNEDLIIGAVYLSPINSSFTLSNDKDVWDILTEEVEHYQSTGRVVLLGDFNARTNKGNDFVMLDNVDHLPLANSYLVDEEHTHSIRNNMDNHNVCSFGRKLLDLCKTSGLRILNGRTTGDLLGAKTCYKWNGASTVDYALCEHRLIHEVRYMKVHDFVGDLSDHCAISVCLKVERRPSNVCEPIGKNPKLRKVKWSSTIERVYSWRLQNNVQHFDVNNYDDTNELVSAVTELLTNALPSRPSHFRYKPNKKRKTKQWFTKDCEAMRRNVRALGKAMAKDPANCFIRHNYFLYVKKYKQFAKRTKKEAKQAILDNLMRLEGKDPKMYWDLVKKLRTFDNENDNKISGISPVQIWEHYNKLLYNKEHSEANNAIEEEIGKISNEQFFSNMDFRISLQEMRLAIKKLKKGKSPGPDGITAEMLLSATPSLENVLHQMFNRIFSEAEFPEDWRRGVIINIHKGGNPFEMNNYRGITLNPILSKVFSIIMNERLNNYIKDNNIINPAQIGFRPKARTTDHIFVLRTVFEKYVRKAGKPVFACFVDFRKAYDSIWRKGLLLKLLRSNVGGKFYNMMADLYRWSSAQCDFGFCLSDDIKCNIGVKQGDVLSPTLFNIYINDLPDKLKGTGRSDETPTLSGKPINCLLYADDLVVLSLSREDLQMKLKQLDEYCKMWKMDINVEKTKVVIFSKKYFQAENFYIGENTIEQVRQYKYLGLLVTDNFNLKNTESNIHDRARKALFSFNKINQNCELTPRIRLALFEKIIEPILLYGCEIWGDSFPQPKRLYADNIWRNAANMQVERLHVSFCKRVLGVHSKATNVAVMGELGKYPLLVKILCQKLKFWKRAIGGEHCNTYLELASKEMLAIDHSVRSSWLSTLKKYVSTLADNSFLNFMISEKNGMFKNKLKESYRTYWRSQLGYDRGDIGKLVLYRRIKNNYIFEAYLDILRNSDLRKCMTELRISCHALEIERGRYMKTPINERLCRFCYEQGNTIVEDEAHFLLKCPQYSRERDALYRTVSAECPQFTSLSDLNKVRFMLTAEGDVCLALSQFCHRSMVLRKANGQGVL